MAKRKSPERRQEILAATFKVLRREGAIGASTAKIAAAANCSKETIYNWFGDREGLFCALVEEQSRVMFGVLDKSINSQTNAHKKLEKFGGALLDMLTGEASILVGRAVVGEIGAGRSRAQMALVARNEQIKKMATVLFENARLEDAIRFQDIDEIWHVFLGLLMGERQMQLQLGAINARPTGGEMSEIAAGTVRKMLLIYANQAKP